MPLHFQASTGPSGDWLGPILIIYGLVWLLVLATTLYRADLDPVTKLTWVVVVIFVPVFGVLLYWFVGPNPVRQKIDPSNHLSGTPWEKDPGFVSRDK